MPQRIGQVTVGLLCLLFVGHTMGETVYVSPNADAMVASMLPDNNYGGAGAVHVASAAGAGDFHSLLRFDLSETRDALDVVFGNGNWQVESFALQLTSAAPGNSLFNSPSQEGDVAVLWMENDGWSEGVGTPSSPGGSADGVTWNAMQSLFSENDAGLGTFSFDGSTSGTATYPLLLPQPLIGDLLAGDLATLHMGPSDAALPPVSAVFRSRSFHDEGSRPLLVVNAVAVPEPAGGIIGLLVVGHWISRRPRRW